ncbi:hypothetical protein ZWY2020_049802 [Hordeum vulgare]|nr:hypothetical protein ZWY2020_049802 [Hordeum vulgare]
MLCSGSLEQRSVDGREPLSRHLRFPSKEGQQSTQAGNIGTLNSLVVTYGGQIGSSSYETIIAELSTLISDIDLHMAALALELSALLQGQALQALQKFFASLVQSANTSFETLLDSLISTAKPSQSGGLSKHALSSIAQCVAVLCLAAGDQKCASTVEMLKGILNDDSSTNSLKKSFMGIVYPELMVEISFMMSQ